MAPSYIQVSPMAPAEEFERRFDAGEDLESLGFDLSKATRDDADFTEAMEAARRVAQKYKNALRALAENDKQRTE